MKLIDTFHEFIEDDDTAQRATFEAAMINRIQTEGYKMSDLIYEIFCCQVAISNLTRELEELKESKPAKKGK